MCVSLVEAGYETHLVATHDGDGVFEGVRLHGLAKAKGRLRRFLGSTRACLERALAVDAAIYHFHDPELIPVGLKLKRLGKTVVYDVHENHSGSLLDRSYLNPLLRPVMAGHVARLEHRADRELDAIVTATPAIARQFSGKRVVVVQNYPLLDEFAKVVGGSQVDRKRQFAFVGGMSAVRGVRECVEAVGMVEDSELVLAGSFTPAAFESELRELGGWSRVRHVGWASREEVASILGESRAGLVLFHPARNHIESQPNKIFEYMAAGLPVIGSDFPLWKSLIEGEGAGLCVDPTSSEAVAGAMRWILEHPGEADAMGARGRKAVEEKFSWEAEREGLLGLYRELLR